MTNFSSFKSVGKVLIWELYGRWLLIYLSRWCAGFKKVMRLAMIMRRALIMRITLIIRIALIMKIAL